MNFERGTNRDLVLDIDSSAGQSAAATRKSELAAKYFRKPPKTRCNYIKMATPYPFGMDWNRLIADWVGAVDKPFYVLRDVAILRALAYGNDVPSAYQAEPCFVAVSLTIMQGKKGCPEEFSMICLPLEADKPTDEAIVEPVRKDPAAKERKVLREQHKSDLKRLAKMRKEATDKEKREQNSSVAIKTVYQEKMRSLWMVEPSNLKTGYHRPIIGFVHRGDFGLSKGQGFAQGFVPIQIVPMLSKKLVLMRNPGTDHYMWANIVIMN